MCKIHTSRVYFWASAINIEKHRKATFYTINMGTILKLCNCYLSLIRKEIIHMGINEKGFWVRRSKKKKVLKEEMGTLGGSKASMSASEALGNLSLMVRFSFFLSAPDSLCWAFASTAFLNIFCTLFSWLELEWNVRFLGF